MQSSAYEQIRLNLKKSLLQLNIKKRSAGDKIIP